MNTVRSNGVLGLVLGGVVLLLGKPSLAGSHTWDVNELFSNPDGTIQFVELWEANGTPGETGINGHTMSSDAESFIINGTVPTAPTTNKFYLLATQAFADLPGAPVPDMIIPAGSVPFFNVNGDSVSYEPWDTMTFGPGDLPTDGIMSLNFDLTTGVNSPTNYNGDTGSVDASPPGPVVPAVSTWGVILLVGLVACAGTMILARRPYAAG